MVPKSKGVCKMNITLSDKEYRLVCAALSYLSANVDDAFEDETINEEDVIELRERLNSLGRT
jgi:hypothetical protein